ncbi:MAG: hypothetical protein IPN77_28725 [Sandaracinaceae bacterium]|nr:hypothetical protein [Sandaracinaceae bacterium]
MSEPTRDMTDRARAELERRSRCISEEDVARLLERRAALEVQFGSEGPLARFAAQERLLFAMVRDYWSGVYPELPWATVASAVAALGYVLSPMAPVPDLAVVDRVDEATVVALCLHANQAALAEYERWLTRGTVSC